MGTPLESTQQSVGSKSETDVTDRLERLHSLSTRKIALCTKQHRKIRELQISLHEPTALRKRKQMAEHCKLISSTSDGVLVPVV